RVHAADRVRGRLPEPRTACRPDRVPVYLLTLEGIRDQGTGIREQGSGSWFCSTTRKGSGDVPGPFFFVGRGFSRAAPAPHVARRTPHVARRTSPATAA